MGFLLMWHKIKKNKEDTDEIEEGVGLLWSFLCSVYLLRHNLDNVSTLFYAYLIWT